MYVPVKHAKPCPVDPSHFIKLAFVTSVMKGGVSHPKPEGQKVAKPQEVHIQHPQNASFKKARNGYAVMIRSNAVSPKGGGDIWLLKDTTRALQEIATFFTSDDERAQAARRRLEKRGKDNGAFYANIKVDLDDLSDVLDRLTDKWCYERGDRLPKVTCFLETVQDQFLDAGDEGASEVSHMDLKWFQIWWRLTSQFAPGQRDG